MNKAFFWFLPRLSTATRGKALPPPQMRRYNAYLSWSSFGLKSKIAVTYARENDAGGRNF